LAQKTDDFLRGAVAAHQAGDRVQAEKLYRLVLSNDKRNPEALHFLGLLRAESGQLDEAAQLLKKAIRANPKSADLHANLGRILSLLDRSHDALQSYEKALALDPDHPAALINCAGTLLNLHLPGRALPMLDRLLSREPRLQIALHNRCVALLDLHRHEDVIADADRLLAIDPHDADAWYKKGMALAALRRPDEAFKAFDGAYAGRPNLPGLEGRRLHAKMFICDWSDIDQEIARMRRHVQEGLNVTTPFALLPVSTSSAEQLRCAQTYIRHTHPPTVARAPSGRARRRDAIHLGYVSGDFREHATAYLTADLFECHDKRRFRLFGISIGPDDRSPIRARVAGAFDEFLDARNLPARAIAEWVREKDIDILVDLNGFCGDGRTDIFRLQPARLQVNFLGYPGTMGAPYIDYIIVDRALVDDDEQAHYSEKCVWLPDSYQPNDRLREISERRHTRREMGLPEEGFVFCCFNNSFKILPEVFDVWMRILEGVDGSVLWLLECGIAEANLRREAERRGIAPHRIVFAKRLPMAEHLSRVRLGDLFLDTLPYNAHTTTSDALWAGVPVITCRGSTFAGRVADSLLRAAGLPDLVTASLSDYERAALRLAGDPAALAEVRHRLLHNRATCPLFDTPRYTRHLELAYAGMWQRHAQGAAPASFRVEPL